MIIPDESVEAAAKELYAREGFWGPLADSPWYRSRRFRKRARAALEAGAPHMLAGAWDEGADAGYELALLEGPAGDYAAKTNPYRGGRDDR